LLNKCILMGRLTQSPELKYTPSNVAVTSFSIAIDRKYQSDGNKQTDFINCTAWRQTAEFICKYFSKGRLINIVGTLQTRTYDGKDGKKVYVTEVIVDEVNFCGDKGKQEQTPPANDGFIEVDSDDELPF
jgi:single-strand DNA-binding protein